jgi:hypothetical protein
MNSEDHKGCNGGLIEVQTRPETLGTEEKINATQDSRLPGRESNLTLSA